MLREVIMLSYGSMIAKYCAEVPTCSADHLRVNLSVHFHLFKQFQQYYNTLHVFHFSKYFP